MDYLHYEYDLTCNDVLVVKLDRQANVKLLDSINYQKYRKNQRHRYYGGLATQTPMTLVAPCDGHWHLVIDLGGYSGRVSAVVNVVKP